MIAATPVADTVKRVRETDGRRAIERTESREGLWGAQTPQVFRADELRRAHAAAAPGAAATDDAMLVEEAGGVVLVEPVAAPNLKVTDAADLELASLLLAARAR